MIALFSIKPEYVEKIFSGEKMYEYRKALYKENVSKIVVYATKPVGKIVGEFDVNAVLEKPPKSLWRETRKHSGVKLKFYNEYFYGRNIGYAIKIGKRKRYQNPVDPHATFASFTAPQSFVYMDESKYKHCVDAAS